MAGAFLHIKQLSSQGEGLGSALGLSMSNSSSIESGSLDKERLRWRLGRAPEILPGPVINPKAPNRPLLLVQEVGDGLGIQLAPVDGATSIRPVLVGDALDITAEDLILPLELAKDCPDIVLVLGSHFSDWNSPFVALHALLCCQHFFFVTKREELEQEHA